MVAWKVAVVAVAAVLFGVVVAATIVLKDFRRLLMWFIVMLAALALTACATTPKEPVLRFPDPPTIGRFYCPKSGEAPPSTTICYLPEDRVDALMEWFDRLQEFWILREALLNPGDQELQAAAAKIRAERAAPPAPRVPAPTPTDDSDKT